MPRPVVPNPWEVPAPVVPPDPYGTGAFGLQGVPTAPAVPNTVGVAGAAPGTGLVRTVNTYAGGFPGVTTPAAATPTGLPGSPLDTLYGVDSESYLTDDQRKLARQIQGKFDASLDSRDRELARYGAPRLSSFVEDEALARAMSLARGLNFPTDAVTDATPGGLRSVDRGGVPRVPATTPTPDNPPPVNPNNPATWQKILTGLTSLIPLLFGKDAYGNFLNKGAIQWVKDKFNETFGTSYNLTPEQIESLVTKGGLPTDGGLVYNPFTGQVVAPGTGAGLPYGPGSNWGLDTPQPTLDADPWGADSGWGNDVIPPVDYSEFYGPGSGWGDVPTDIADWFG